MDYAQFFRTVPEKRLVEIITWPAESDPNAVTAAHRELDRRAPSEEELRSLVASLQEERDRIQAQRSKRERSRQHLIGLMTEARETFIVHPDPERQDRRHARILFLLVLGIWCVFIPHYRLLPALFGERWDLSVLDELLPLILLPVSLVLLWLRRRGGWFLASGMTLCLALLSLIQLVRNWRIAGHPHDGPFPMLFPVPSRYELVTGACVTAGFALAFQWKRSLRIYRIEERERRMTVAAAGVLVVWMIWGIL